MNKYKIHFPDETVGDVSNDDIENAGLARLYSFKPEIDSVFWIEANYSMKYFQIAEMSEQNIYVEEISKPLYNDIISGRPKKYFYFKEISFT